MTHMDTDHELTITTDPDGLGHLNLECACGYTIAIYGPEVTLDQILTDARTIDGGQHRTTIDEAHIWTPEQVAELAAAGPTIRDIVDADLKPTLDAITERQQAWAGPIEEMMRMALEQEDAGEDLTPPPSEA